VENAYLDGSNVVVREHCAYSILPLDSGWMLVSDSEFRGLVEPAVFGDQEEMGFGVRVATPLTVERGGRILNSAGAVNEEAVWGKQAVWADYSGEIEGAPAGLTVLTHPKNFRESWFHARDYGLLLANPFGRNAFTQGDKSAVRVTAEEPLRLVFGVYVHDQADESGIRQAYEQFAGLPEPEQKEP
jgi:hypothetical protein